MKLTFTVAVILCPLLVLCQQSKNLISSSGQQDISNFTINASLGQSFVQQTESNYHLSEGFQQYFISEKYHQEITDLVQIFPNPTVDVLNIKSDRELLNIIVYNEIGAQVLVIQNIHQNEYTLPFQSFVSGIYFLDLEYEDGSKSMDKFFKF